MPVPSEEWWWSSSDEGEKLKRMSVYMKMLILFMPQKRYGLPCTDFGRIHKCSTILCSDPLSVFTQI
jgi:hypothetical protein